MKEINQRIILGLLRINFYLNELRVFVYLYTLQRRFLFTYIIYNFFIKNLYILSSFNKYSGILILLIFNASPSGLIASYAAILSSII